MAAPAQVKSGANPAAKPAGQKPVSAHPLFPAIVALWFAALLGIGSLVLPQALYDKLGVAMGLGSLGFSARLGLAVVAGGIGGALGMFLARKAAGSHSAEPLRARKPQTEGPAAATKRPISAMEELGSDRLDEPLTSSGQEPFAGRRRALAVTDESGPSEYLAHVPLPGGEPTLDLIGADLLEEENALELERYEEPQYQAPVPFARAEEVAAPRQMFQPPAPEPDMVQTEPDRHFEVFEPDWSPAPAAPLDLNRDSAPAPFAAPAAAPRPFAPPPPFNANAAPFAAPPVAAPAAPFTPPAAPAPFGQGSPAAPFSMPVPTSMPEPEPAQPFAVEPVTAPVATTPSEPLAGPAPLAVAARPVFAPYAMPHDSKPMTAAGAPLSGLALTDLIDRFAQALRRADPASLTEAMPAGLRQFAPVPEAALADPDAAIAAVPDALPAEVSPAMPVTESRIPYAANSIPAALQPIGFDEHDNYDENEDSEELFDHPIALTMAIEPKPFAAPGTPATPFGMPQQVDLAADEPDQDAEQEDAFGSLLAMKSGFGPGKEFVRVEDEPEVGQGIEPVVVFPGMASPGRAAPAADGPSREPATAAPFAPPPFSQPGFARAPFGQPQAVPAEQTGTLDRTATEQALRDALAKLQQMSGAA